MNLTKKRKSNFLFNSCIYINNAFNNINHLFIVIPILLIVAFVSINSIVGLKDDVRKNLSFLLLKFNNNICLI